MTCCLRLSLCLYCLAQGLSPEWREVSRWPSTRLLLVPDKWQSLQILYLPFVWVAVFGESVDKINFFLRCISIINSALSTCCTFNIRFTLSFILREFLIFCSSDMMSEMFKNFPAFEFKKILPQNFCFSGTGLSIWQVSTSELNLLADFRFYTVDDRNNYSLPIYVDKISSLV